MYYNLKMNWNFGTLENYLNIWPDSKFFKVFKISNYKFEIAFLMSDSFRKLLVMLGSA